MAHSSLHGFYGVYICNSVAAKAERIQAKNPTSAHAKVQLARRDRLAMSLLSGFCSFRLVCGS